MAIDVSHVHVSGEEMLVVAVVGDRVPEVQVRVGLGRTVPLEVGNKDELAVLVLLLVMLEQVQAEVV